MNIVAALIVAAVSFVFNIYCMMYGFGLTVQSWGWLITSCISSGILSTVAQSLLYYEPPNEKDE